MTKRAELALGILGAVVSASSITSYFSKTLDTYETELLKGTAGYVKKYEGNPKEALDYIQRTLKIVENAKFQPEIIGGLEKEVSIAIEQIGGSPTVYRPVLDNLSEKFENASFVKMKENSSLFWGIIGGLSSALLISIGLMSKRKDI